MPDSSIFIVGANRSGTTLLRLLLNAHSEIAIPDEINYFYGFSASGVSYEHWTDAQLSADQYATFVDRFLETNRSKVSELDLKAIRTKILDAPQDFRRPYQVLLEEWARHFGKSRWGEKTPGNIYHSNILIEMFPDAQFIHVVRDPRAGVASMQRVPFFGNDVTLNALYRHKIMTHGRDWLARAVPSSQYIEVRYEDLVLAPVKTLARICTFIEVPYEDGMLRFHEDANRFMVTEAAENYNSAATRPISADRMRKWREHLTEHEVAIIERICEDEMHEFGYPLLRPSLPWMLKVKVAFKRMYWWLQWLRHRNDRHFVILTPIFSRFRSRLRSLKNRIMALQIRPMSSRG
jgi:hypothetical protein